MKLTPLNWPPSPCSLPTRYICRPDHQRTFHAKSICGLTFNLALLDVDHPSEQRHLAQLDLVRKSYPKIREQLDEIAKEQQWVNVRQMREYEEDRGI